MPKVFLSYRHVTPDEECAANLAAILESKGLDVFIDKKIAVGHVWAETIEQQLKNADHFVVLLSAEAIRSDMVRQEVADAHVLARTGQLRVYPIRIAFDGALPYDLGAYLNPLQSILWKPGESWEAICDTICAHVLAPAAVTPKRDGNDISSDGLEQLAALTDGTGAPLPAADPRLDTGAVEIDSPFYVERSADSEVTRLVTGTCGTVLIKGARQVGKTSLLSRAKGAVERSGHRVVYIDFQLVDDEHLATLKALAMYFAHRLARTLRTSVKPADVWDDGLGAPESLTDFIEQAILGDAGSVTICLDEVDRIFDYAYRNSFFAMVRAWHNRRATSRSWKQFGLIMAHSTEPSLFIDDVNQSPFNVGQVFRLGDFDLSNIQWLNQKHSRPLKSETDLKSLQTLVGGHPYLVRQALYLLATKQVGSLSDLLATAAEDEGPFGDHLRRHLFGLRKKDRIAAAFKKIVRDQGCDDETDFQRLRAGGLVAGASRESARPRCDLYRRYFRKHL